MSIIKRLFKKKKKYMQEKLIVKRVDHYEVHFFDRVEFWDETMSKQLGVSKVHGC